MKRSNANLDAKGKGLIFALIPAPDGAGVLAEAVPGTDGCTLPLFRTTARTLTDSVVHIIEQEAQAAIGLRLHFLGCPAFSRTGGDEPYVAVAIFENYSPSLLDGARLQYLSVGEAARRLPPKHVALVQTTLAEWASGQFPMERAAWSRPGWQAQATAWMETVLAANDLTLTGTVEARRLWSITALLRAPTTGGEVYFKAVPAIFAVEPALTRFLGQRFSGQVPDVIATDPRHWLLMRAFTARPLVEFSDPSTWTAALRGYAELQKSLVSHGTELLRLGCPLRPLSALQQHTRFLLDDVDALQLDQERGLASADYRALLEFLPVFDQAAGELAALGLPNTLEHGDLHAHNIAVRSDGSFIYYDWTDGCLAQPMLGLAPFLEVAPPEMHAALCNAYLEPWREYAADPQLRRGLRVACVLSALHLAYSYHNIRRATETRQHWELAGALAYFLREALRHARLLDA